MIVADLHDTLAAASPLTTSVMVPGSLLRVLSLIWFLLVDRQQAELHREPRPVVPIVLPGQRPHALQTVWDAVAV